MSQNLMICSAVHELGQVDLEVWYSETLPDAPSVLGNLAEICV